MLISSANHRIVYCFYFSTLSFSCAHSLSFGENVIFFRKDLLQAAVAELPYRLRIRAKTEIRI